MEPVSTQAPHQHQSDDGYGVEQGTEQVVPLRDTERTLEEDIPLVGHYLGVGGIVALHPREGQATDEFGKEIESADDEAYDQQDMQGLQVGSVFIVFHCRV